MKKNISYLLSMLLFFVLTTFFVSCDKDTVIDTSSQLGISHITYFADLSMQGNAYMSVVQGNTFTDPGCTATQEGQTIPVTTTGSVNTSQVNFYTLTYSAVNSDGYSSSVNRTVAVLPSAEVPGTDISGSYYYVATGGNNSTITKLAPGLYSTTNCWSNATTISMIFICVDGSSIIIPFQETPYGGLFGTGTLATDGSLTYVISLTDQGISNSSRAWHKQ